MHPPTKENQKRWADIVAKSNGNSLFLPEGFMKDWEEIDTMRMSYNEKMVKMAEEEIHMNVKMQAFWLKVREHLAKNGYPDVWVKQIGSEEGALKQGIVVINLTENQR